MDSERGHAWAAQRANMFGSAAAADLAGAADIDPRRYHLRVELEIVQPDTARRGIRGVVRAMRPASVSSFRSPGRRALTSSASAHILRDPHSSCFHMLSRDNIRFTNYLAVQMIFYPIRWRGLPIFRVEGEPLGLIGWQGESSARSHLHIRPTPCAFSARFGGK